jgi:hypothetical protein
MSTRIEAALTFAMATAIMAITVFGAAGVDPTQTGRDAQTRNGLPSLATAGSGEALRP